MADRMWFGTRDYSTWVLPPTVNMGAAKVGWANKVTFLNGGAAVRRSTSAHREYEMSWNMAPLDELRQITDFADGIYGDGPIYWADPFTMKKNMLPQHWAAPMQGLSDGIVLAENGAERGELVNTPLNNFAYPVKSIRYTVGPDTFLPELYLPIPLGYTAWIGVHGQAGTGAGVIARAATGPEDEGEPIAVPILPVTTAQRFNTSLASSNGANRGLILSLGGSGTVVLSGLMVQMLPQEAEPATGGFISGQGHSGCRFAEQPDLTAHNAFLDRGGLSTTLVETGSWE